jgi:hypothetical protein
LGIHGCTPETERRSSEESSELEKSRVVVPGAGGTLVDISGWPGLCLSGRVPDFLGNFHLGHVLAVSRLKRERGLFDDATWCLKGTAGRQIQSRARSANSNGLIAYFLRTGNNDPGYNEADWVNRPLPGDCGENEKDAAGEAKKQAHDPELASFCKRGDCRDGNGDLEHGHTACEHFVLMKV